MQIRSLSLTVLLAIVGTACKRQPAPEEQAPAPPSPSPQAVASATPKADTVGWGWDSPEAARLSGVRYAPPRQVFGTLGIPSGQYFDSLGPGYAIGSLVDGPYRGADIVSAERRTDDPCKGPGCDDPTYLRFARTGAQLIYLRRNSDLGSYFERESWRTWTAAFATSGLTLVSDSTFAVRAFLPSDTLLYASNTFRRVSRSCGDSSLRVAFRHPVFQNVRFDGRLFHATRPDGSCLTFEYLPYFSDKEILWDSPPHEPSRSGYSWKENDEFGTLELRYGPFVSPDTVQLDRDTRIVGRTQRSEPVYELKNPDHPLLRQFYKDYEADVAHAAERDIGLVILIELPEQWMIGILQLVHGLTALCTADDPGIPIELYGIGGDEGAIAQFEGPELVILLP